MLAFRERYPHGRNYVLCPAEGEPYRKTVAGLEVTFLSPAQWPPPLPDFQALSRASPRLLR
jgi:hypothetical protein